MAYGNLSSNLGEETAEKFHEKLVQEIPEFIQLDKAITKSNGKRDYSRYWASIGLAGIQGKEGIGDRFKIILRWLVEQIT